MAAEFEIHITTSDVLKEQIIDFESFCESIEAKAIIIELSEGMYPVIRTKIEVAPWHRESVGNYFKDQSKTYYEWHGKVHVNDEILIKSLCKHYNAKISRNSLKGDLSRKFITMREDDDEQAIVFRIQELKQSLASEGIYIVKEELEFCIYDSYRNLDKGWIN